ncbi:hypothetical protein B0H13DRAFT_1936522 [Mycena leptocephala]|nr:hypothetical protein B0H13DRAFT_1936522 [Mycena leptocephala]
MDRNPPPAVTKVRKWTRIPVLTIPVIPPLPLASTSSNSAPQTPATPNTPATLASSSTQASLRAPKRTKWEKVDDVLTGYGFDNLGDFLARSFKLFIQRSTSFRLFLVLAMFKLFTLPKVETTFFFPRRDKVGGRGAGDDRWHPGTAWATTRG